MFSVKRRRRLTRFDQHALSCILLRALDEIDAGTGTATEATGLSRAELREMLTYGFPHINISAFALARAADPEPNVEEQQLRDLLLAHARPCDPVSASFAKIIAHRAMRTHCLWQDLGLFDRDELSRLLAIHFPTLVSSAENIGLKKSCLSKGLQGPRCFNSRAPGGPTATSPAGKR
ncbi:nitrogen fixation protein NifQ [Mesorhizobium atlanticum]|uniref:Nitrogen fixation protein NifQ n=2 Tax=Mesorhizobium atlanticum TaxID=2233532 RepID=A0A330GGK6_9HYPH|nr:nitrogen fixation protein NifQ [Mesorhizobium atlanticum]